LKSEHENFVEAARQSASSYYSTRCGYAWYS